MMNRGNQSRHFLQGLPLYDFYISTKSYHVSELQALGCPKVLFMENAYDPHTHRPVPLDDMDRQRLGGPVGFIGQWEPERAELLRSLALAGIPVRVWGYTWERMKDVPSGMRIENRPLWGDDYARALCAFDINLCFLRKCNRDLQTTRSMEIPACGGFMLAEHSQEHESLFADCREAVFFRDDQDLVRKTRYYLDHPDERQGIAENGMERCLSSGYSYKERLARVLDQVRLL
jgi:spore maturation protein CgeB